MRSIYLLGLGLCLAGCEVPHVAAGNQAGGLLSGVLLTGVDENSAAAFQAAQDHCGKYGKIAKISNAVNRPGASSSTLTFDCIDR